MGLPRRALEARGRRLRARRRARLGPRAPTVRRDDAPLGVGSLQRFVDADFEQHYFTLLEDEAYHPQLQRMCAFDLIANNTDRKGGHCLVDGDGHIWGIDNGLSFAAEFKLRTVIWDFAGEPVPDDVHDAVGASSTAACPAELDDLLDTFERDAITTRARALVPGGLLPHRPERSALPLAAGLSAQPRRFGRDRRGEGHVAGVEGGDVVGRSRSRVLAQSCTW